MMHILKMLQRTTLPASVLALAAVAACDPYDAYCAKMEQCAEDNEEGFEDIDTDDDYRAVCATQLRSSERVLRANEEETCQVVADAYRLHIACLASLDCDDLNDEIREPDKCEDERDDYDDALEDAEDDCNTSCSTMGTNTAPALIGLVALVLRARSRRSRRPV